MRTRTGGAIAACLLAFSGASQARADVDVELDPKAKVSGTLDVEETETFRFEGTAGAQLALTVKAKKKADLDLALRLTGPGGDVALTGGSTFKDKGKSLKIKGVTLPENGTYTLVLTATGSGEYSLKLTAKPQKTFADTITLPASGDGVVTFSAPRGAKVVIKATQPNGSEAFPLVVGPAVLKRPKHAQTFPSLDEGGLQTFTIRNQVGTAGDVDVAIKVTPPKLKTGKVDVRAATLGNPGGGETALSATVEAAAGGEVEILDPDSSIDGAGVLIPPGALDVDTRVTVSSASLIDPPSPTTQQSAGPAVEFGPDGLAFGVPADVTVPFDSDALPADANPLTDLFVLRESSDGAQEVIVPTSVDVPNGVCTVPASGFSVFMPFVRRGIPNLDGDTYWLGGIELCMLPDFGGQADSRDRELFSFAGTITFGQQSVIADSTVSFVETNTTFTHADDGRGFVTLFDNPPETETAVWNIEPDGQTIRVAFDSGPGTDEVLYYVAEDGSVLLARTFSDPTDACGVLEVALRRPETTSTATSVAGRFWFGGIDVSVGEDPGQQAPVRLESSVTFGEMELRANGTWSVDIDSAARIFDPFIGLTERAGSQSDTGTFRIAGPGDGALEGSVVLSGDEAPDFLRILPSADGQSLLAFAPSLGEEGGGFFIGVRRSTNLTRADIAGTSGGRSVGIPALNTYQVPGGPGPVTVGDFAEIFDLDELRLFAPNGDLSFERLFERTVRRDPLAGPDGIRVDFGPVEDDESLRVTVGRDGKVRLGGDDIVGAFTPDGVFGFTVGDPRTNSPELILDVHVRLPPASEVTEPGF